MVHSENEHTLSRGAGFDENDLASSQAGRRRFDRGRPLQLFSQQNQLLAKMSGLRRGRAKHPRRPL
jgi:hypothetical protein